MHTLNKMLEVKPDIIYPSHGPVVPHPQKYISHYIQHRHSRESQILQTLQTDIAQTSEELVDKIYTVIKYL